MRASGGGLTGKKTEKGQVWTLVIRAGEACGEHKGPHCPKRGLRKSQKEALATFAPGGTGVCRCP